MPLKKENQKTYKVCGAWHKKKFREENIQNKYLNFDISEWVFERKGYVEVIGNLKSNSQQQFQKLYGNV